MKAMLLAATCMVSLATHPAYARGEGGAFGAGLLGGVIGGAIGGALTQPRYAPPPPPPPVIYERPVYVRPAPVYVAPAPRVAYHPWPGPGFACYQPEANSVNRAICGSEDLSAAALSVQEAMIAAIQQTPYNAGPLRAEYAGFLQNVRATCAPINPSQQGDCIAAMMSHEHDAFADKLTGAYAEEAARPVTVSVQVQQQLHQVGLLPGVADGLYGDSTRRAMANWQSGQRRPATGVLSDEEVAMLVPGFGPAVVPASPALAAKKRSPAPGFDAGGQVKDPAPEADAPQTVAAVQPAPVPAPSPAPTPTPDPAPAVVPASTGTDLLGGLHEGMPYALARPKLFAAGWQTQFFTVAGLSDGDRETRQWFIDHHVSEVEDCSSSGCKMQFHNADGRLLYVYTQVGSHTSDAYKGAGPSVIAYCLDNDDIACSPAPAPAGAVVQQAVK